MSNQEIPLPTPNMSAPAEHQRSHIKRLASVGLLAVGVTLASPITSAHGPELPAGSTLAQASASEESYTADVPDSKPLRRPQQPTDIPRLTPTVTETQPSTPDKSPTIKPKTKDDNKDSGKKSDTEPPEANKPVTELPTIETSPEPMGPETALRTLEIGTVPADVETIMQTETVYMDWAGCSGFLIRNQEQTPVGVLTAEHCGLMGKNRPRTTGSDGNTYIVIESGAKVSTGESKDTLQNVGTLDKFILPLAADTTQDVAFGVFEGHTPEEVLASYSHLNEEQIQSLEPGTPLYMSGWPADQDNNPGALKRQSFAMSVIGTDETTTAVNNETIKILWTAARSTADGAKCTFGSSGAEGFALDSDNQPTSVGTLAAFVDLKGDIYYTPEQGEYARQYMSYKFNVDLSDPTITALCGFSYVMPVGERGEVVNVVNNITEAPGHEVITPPIPEHVVDPEFLTQIHNEFFDPTIPKNIIEGVVMIQGNKDVEYIQNATLFIDQNTGDTVIGHATPHSKTGLSLVYLSHIDSVFAYDIDDTPGINIKQTTGSMTYNIEANSFTDEAGISIGQELLTNPVIKQIYQLVTEQDGSMSFVPALNGKGDVAAEPVIPVQ